MLKPWWMPGALSLIVGARLTNCASDRNELVADIAAIPAVLGRPATVLADNGYANGDEVAALAESGIEALVSTAAEGRRRRHDFRPAKAEAPVKEPKAEWLQVHDGETRQRGRPCAVPAAPADRRAGLRHHQGGARLHRLLGCAASTRWPAEWDLVALAYNCKRLHKLKLEMGRVTALLARQADPKARPQPRSLGDPPPHRSVRTHPRGFAELRSRL